MGGDRLLSLLSAEGVRMSEFLLYLMPVQLFCASVGVVALFLALLLPLDEYDSAREQLWDAVKLALFVTFAYVTLPVFLARRLANFCRRLIRDE